MKHIRRFILVKIKHKKRKSDKKMKNKYKFKRERKIRFCTKTCAKESSGKAVGGNVPSLPFLRTVPKIPTCVSARALEASNTRPISTPNRLGHDLAQVMFSQLEMSFSKVFVFGSTYSTCLPNRVFNCLPGKN